MSRMTRQRLKTIPIRVFIVGLEAAQNPEKKMIIKTYIMFLPKIE